MMEWASSVSSVESEELISKLFSKQPQTITNILPDSWLMYTDRLYLASYTTPPTQDTLFPYPDRQPSRRSPSKRSARAVDGPSAVTERDRTPPHYFSIDDSLLYNAFHHDFGPLHIGHLYRFAVQFHDILGAPENKDKPVVFWSKADARSKPPSSQKHEISANTLAQVGRTPHAFLRPIWFSSKLGHHISHSLQSHRQTLL